jgi:hypothetical protein
MWSGTKIGGSVSPKHLRKKQAVSCSKSKEKNLVIFFSCSCPGPSPRDFLLNLPPYLPTAACHILSLPRMRHTMVTTKDWFEWQYLLQTLAFLLYSSPFVRHLFLYYTFIRPRTVPDTRHWHLQSDIATTRPLARCWKATVIYWS